MLIVALGALLAAGQEYLPDLPAEHPAIRYAERPVDDAVARLARDLGDDTIADLAALLDRLDVPVDSQALAFAKTSFQASRVAPDNPRAIYFNDEVAVAFVRGSEMIELAAYDPAIGPVFYTASLEDLRAEGFERRQVCLECHLGPATSGVPGLFVGSVYPGPDGKPAAVDAIITDHRTPLEERWGGWYVNAVRGQQKDRSNAVASSPAEPLRLDEGGTNLTHLYGKIEPEGYLAPVSDIVALMTFEHQTQMLNYFTRVNWEDRIARHESEENAGGGDSSRERGQLDADLDALVGYMLFEGEASLTEPVEGVSTFTETFPRRGPRDSKGRSLRDFDLERRLFRYPLSYMIYSRAFEGLSDELKGDIFRRLYDRLDGEGREVVLEILRETKPGLPPYYMKTTPNAP